MHLAAFVAVLAAFGGDWLGRARETVRNLLTRAFQEELTAAGAMTIFRDVVVPLITPLLIAGIALTLFTLLVQLAATRGGIAGKKLAPDFKRLNPVTKLTSLPGQNFPIFLQAVILLPLFGVAVYLEIGENLTAYLELPFLSAEAGASRVAGSLQTLLWRAVALLLTFAFAEFVWQRWRYTKSLRMTKQEIREEFKEQEGDPLVKMRVRRIQRDLARRNMMKKIPTATAVIVNPTHYSVAIKYSIDSPGAPTVVAKGKNYLALRIRAKALEHNIPIVENPPLSRALYGSVDVGQEIPTHLFRAVAEILVYIYKLKNGKL